MAVTLHPVSRNVTHIVVEDNDGRQRLVPLKVIEKTGDDDVWLNCTEDELKKMTLFLTNEYVERAPQKSGDWTEEEGEWEDGVDVSQFERTDNFGMPVVVEKVPPGEIAFHRKTDIEATDDYVGEVEKLIIEPDTGHITHLVWEKGHLWGKKHIMIPLTAVDNVDYDSVYLNVDKDTVENFPEQPE
ncbi:MAG: PRC-barrel domain-containing protein [Candidatus Promineifilaceae bacterium]